MDSEYLTKALSSAMTAFGVLLWTGIFFHSIVDRYVMVSQGRNGEQKILSDGEIVMSLLGLIAFICFLSVSLASFFLLPAVVRSEADGRLTVALRVLLITIEVLFNGVGLIWLATIIRFNKYRDQAAQTRGRRMEDRRPTPEIETHGQHFHKRWTDQGPIV